MKETQKNSFQISKGKRKPHRRGPTRFYGLMKFSKAIGYSSGHVYRVLHGNRENQETVDAYVFWLAQASQEATSQAQSLSKMRGSAAKPQNKTKNSTGRNASWCSI